jgi:hypothetical protein
MVAVKQGLRVELDLNNEQVTTCVHHCGRVPIRVQ